jgi:hypothetical protein
MRVVVATLAVGLGLAGCGPSDQPAPAAKPTAKQERPDPKILLEQATKTMNDAGTGSHVTDVFAIGLTIEGDFDLDKKAFSQTLTTRPPDLPDDFTVRSLVFEDEAFARVSTGPASECWMRFEVNDFAAVQSVADIESVEPTDLTWTAPPAAEILRDPKPRGYASKKTTTNVAADVDLVAAFSAGMPKAANALAEQIDEDLTVRAVLTVVDGQYTGASYVGKDLFSAADIRPRDLKAAGLSGDGFTAKQAFDLFSSLEVQIEYEDFGQKVDIVRPKEDEIADVDFVDLAQGDAFTCKAAER